MKKLLIILITIFAFNITVYGSYTLDTIYTSYDEDTALKPYLKPSIGFTLLEPENILLSQNTIYFHYNEAEKPISLNGKIMPLNARQDEITYSSSDETVATVDKNGVVTSRNKLGSAIITARSGQIKAECRVSVIVGVTDVKIKSAPDILYADKPVSVQLKTEVFPENAGLKDVLWESSDTSIATVDRTGTVTPSGVGEVTITAITKDKGIRASHKIKVDVFDMPLRAIFITNAVDEIPLGAEYKLKYHSYPKDITYEKINWSSSDNSIVSIDSEGKITAKKIGTAKISLSSEDFSDDFKIQVINADIDNFEYNIISKSVAQRLKELKEDVVYSYYDISLYDAIDIQEQSSPTVFTTNAYPATRTDIENNISPSELTEGYHKYQFLDLSKSNGVSIDVLNNYLEGKGVLEGKGDVFYNAAKKYNISEVYLVVHACLESGNGTSHLATGVDYNGETVYNMFGIGAIDASPLEGGAQYAYSNGWTSVDKAIWGGAQWISKYYINNSQYKQNTLYKMRWNPQEPGVHQYATDVEWATKQAKTLKNMFAAFPRAVVSFDYPIYLGEEELVLSVN